MTPRATAILAVMALACALPAASWAITPYSQNFEGLNQADPAALANDGWVVYGNVSSPSGTYLYGYGPFPAPNDGSGFCQLTTGEGGTEQGALQLVVYSDYQNADHANGNIIESNVYHEQTIEAGDVGTTWTFAFQAKLGNIEGASTAAAFLKTLDPDNGYALTNYITTDMTSIPATWNGYEVSITVDASLAGQLLQFGFVNTATYYEGSGIFYDNLDFHQGADVAVPDATEFAGNALRQNHPNPFNPRTEIDFSLARTGTVSLVGVRPRRSPRRRPCAGRPRRGRASRGLGRPHRRGRNRALRTVSLCAAHARRRGRAQHGPAEVAPRWPADRCPQGTLLLSSRARRRPLAASSSSTANGTTGSRHTTASSRSS